ncbi:MAG: DUF6765 family protein [Neptuniibacter sp.]
MQLDMHYYGTYAIARSAGLSEEACKIIAYSAQFVDDNAANDFIEFDDGARIDAEATAHHPVDIKNVLDFDPKDQRRLWVPFHFLPGNEGDSYTQKLRCGLDSQIAKEMVGHHTAHIDSAYGLHLAGITAHVYEDTFSHYGFSGVSSRGNRVDQESFQLGKDLEPGIKGYLLGKAKAFFDEARTRPNSGSLPNIRGVVNNPLEIGKATIAETGGALGHGSVATYPDRPYLSWRFIYEDGVDSGWRNNQTTFLAGCKALHAFFCDIATQYPQHSSGPAIPFEDIEASVTRVLATQENKAGRIEAWQDAARAGDFGIDAPIPTYSSIDWSLEWQSLKKNPNCSNKAHDTNIYQFYRAAAFHRVYVLRDLLPQHGLVVD